MPSNPHGHGSFPQEPPKPNHHKLLSLLLKSFIMTLLVSLFFLFLGVAAVLLILFIAAGSLHRSSRGHRRCCRLSPRAAVRRLPHFRFSGSSSASSASAAGDCVICLDAFRDGQCCRTLAACGHSFHRRCVDAWLVKSSACPICRTRVRLDFGDGVSGPARDLEEEAKRWWGSRVW